MTVHNPLLGRQPQRPGRVTLEMLIAHAADLNNKRFVIASGKSYFVSKRIEPDGKETHYLDRTP